MPYGRRGRSCVIGRKQRLVESDSRIELSPLQHVHRRRGEVRSEKVRRWLSDGQRLIFRLAAFLAEFAADFTRAVVFLAAVFELLAILRADDFTLVLAALAVDFTERWTARAERFAVRTDFLTAFPAFVAAFFEREARGAGAGLCSAAVPRTVPMTPPTTAPTGPPTMAPTNAPVAPPAVFFATVISVLGVGDEGDCAGVDSVDIGKRKRAALVS